MLLALFRHPSAQIKSRTRRNFRKHTDTVRENRLPLKTYPAILKNQRSKPNFRGGRSFVEGTILISEYPLSIALMQTLAAVLDTRGIKQM